MDKVEIAYNADKSWPKAFVTSSECYGCCGSGGMLTESQNFMKRNTRTTAEMFTFTAKRSMTRPTRFVNRT